MQDVIVVGAGPAGCAAANILAKNGQTVTVIERCRLPRNKPCSGVLIGKTLQLLREHFGEVPRAALCTPHENRGMVFFGDDGRESRFEQKGLNVWRSPFDFWLLEQAKAQGAKLIEGRNATALTQGDGFAEVALSDGTKLRAKYVINCSGAAGGLRAGREFIYTYQVFYRGSSSLDPHYFYAFTDPRFSEYDAWYNVKDDMPVVGIAVREPKNAAAFHRAFLRFLQEKFGFSAECAERAERWVMPRIRPDCPIYCGEGNILCAGEAAGFLNPMGEGISSALASGIFAASAIVNERENALPAYAESVRELREYMSRQWKLLSFLSERFSKMRGENEKR